MIKNEWGKQEKSLNIFISSPSDVESERESIHSVVNDVNRTLGTKLGLFLRIKDWKEFRASGQCPEEFLKKQLQDCDLFIMIFYRRFGSPPSSNSNFQSGTEFEYEIAQELRKISNNNHPEICAYFKEINDNILLNDPGPELNKVLKFKKMLMNTIFYKEYKSTEIFPFMLKDHIIEWLYEITEESKDGKKEILRRFFDLGTTKENPIPSTIIIYPRSDQKIGDPSHLLPYMILEDFQSIHKLTKCLNIAGYENVHACSLDLYEKAREKHQNEIFLCLPRNEPAQDCLRQHQEKRFSIEKREENEKKIWVIIWQSSLGEKIEVRSPQTLYLLNQRTKQHQNWADSPGRCYAEDFAVIAKFNRTQKVNPNDKLKQFFIFGLRGLGTWGAAWYLDRHTEELMTKFSTTNDVIQMLLKVTYCNNRIRFVEDVSDQTQKYFIDELDPNIIVDRIKLNRNGGT